MKNDAQIALVIPALNEERSIGKVISAIPRWADSIIMADNGSTDRTYRNQNGSIRPGRDKVGSGIC